MRTKLTLHWIAATTCGAFSIREGEPLAGAESAAGGRGEVSDKAAAGADRRGGILPLPSGAERVCRRGRITALGSLRVAVQVEQRIFND